MAISALVLAATILGVAQDPDIVTVFMKQVLEDVNNNNTWKTQIQQDLAGGMNTTFEEKGTFEGYNGNLVSLHDLATKTSPVYNAVNTSYLQVGLNLQLGEFGIAFDKIATFDGVDTKTSASMNLEASLDEVRINIGMAYNLTKCVTLVKGVQVNAVAWKNMTLTNGDLVVVNEFQDLVLQGKLDTMMIVIQDPKDSTWEAKLGLQAAIAKLEDIIKTSIGEAIRVSVANVLKSQYDVDICHKIDV